MPKVLQLLLTLAPALAFAPRAMPNIRIRSNVVQPLKMVAVPERTPFIVTGNNVEVTNALRDYTDKRLATVLSKHKEYVLKTEVHLTVTRNPAVKDSHIAECTVAVKGNTLRSSHRCENMYASIDLMAEGLARKLRKYKERRRNKMHNTHGHSALKEIDQVVDADEEENYTDAGDEYADEAMRYGPAVDMDIVKRKAFPMEPISAEEAVMCLEYIDHPFYVFRDQESGEVNVVYKRNHGGIGLIQPEQ